jgi:hypothetical protein
MDTLSSDESYRLSSSEGNSMQPGCRMSRAFPLLPIVGLVGLVIVIAFYRPLDRTPIIIVGFILCFSATLLISRVQQKAKRGQDVGSYFPMTTWLAFGPGLLAIVLFVNCALDHLPVDKHEETVTRLTITYHKGTSYRMQFSSWRPNRPYEEVSLSARVYYQFHVNDRIIVDVHRGALHIPWLGNIRKVSSSQ